MTQNYSILSILFQSKVLYIYIYIYIYMCVCVCVCVCVYVCIIHLQQLKGDLDISNTVDSTGALKVVGVASTDVSNCSVFLVLYIKRPLRKMHTKIFVFSLFILGLCFKVYLSSQNIRTVFAYETV